MQVSVTTALAPYGLVRASANVTKNAAFARDATGDEEPYFFEEMRVSNTQGKSVLFDLSQQDYDSLLDALVCEYHEAREEIAERRLEREQFYA